MYAQTLSTKTIIPPFPTRENVENSSKLRPSVRSTQVGKPNFPRVYYVHMAIHVVYSGAHHKLDHRVKLKMKW